MRIHKHKNAIALICEKILRTSLNLIVFATLARTIGPDGLGYFGLVQAIFFLGHPLALVANDQLLIKFLVSENRQTRNLINTALKIKYIAASFVFLASIIIGYSLFSVDLFTLLFVYCLIHFVNLDVIYFSYFRSKEMSQDVLYLTACIVIPFAILKILAAIIYKDLLLVTVCYVTEATVLSLLARYSFTNSAPNEALEREKLSTTAGELFKTAWPIFSAAALIIFYSRVDLFMISAMLTPTDTGHYTAITKISDASTIIMTAFLSSRYPRLLKTRQQNEKDYQQQLITLMRISLIYSLCSTFFIHLFGDLVLTLLYGRQFVIAKQALVVHFSGTIFIYLGLVCSQWLLAENLQIYRFYRVLAGLAVNIALNFILIPIYGITGAAIATLLTQLFSSIIFNSMNKKTHPIFRLQVRSIFQTPKIRQ